MPRDAYHGSDLRALGRRVHDMHPGERIRVSCVRCGRDRVYSWETFRAYRSDCPVVWLEQMLKPSCFDIVTEKHPLECVREIAWLDATVEDVGCSEEG